MKKEIYLAAGCFWGAQKYFSLIKGVEETEVGYANGKTENPTYEQVCKTDTGHVEAVRVVYEDTIVSLPFLLDLFFDAIDPTTLNRQGGDVGSQYRTGIYFVDSESEAVAREEIAKLQTRISAPVVTEVLPLEVFYQAEEYHQRYLDKNPSGYCHIGPDMFAKAKQAVMEK